jgi:hypothetical protein
MPLNSDIRQSIIIALESQGADVASAIRDVLRDIGHEQDVLTKQWEEGSVSVEHFIAQMKGLVAEINKYRGALDVTREAEGEALRARIDAYARKEREELAAIERVRVAEITAMGERAQAYARFERGVEQHTKELAAFQGNEKRDRIDALVREEQELEKLNTALERKLVAREKEAAAEAWMTRQTTELSNALEGMAEHERIAAASGQSFNQVIDAMAGKEQAADGGLKGFVSTIKAMPTPVNVARDALGGLASKIQNYTSGLGGMSEAQIRAASGSKGLSNNFDGVGKSTRAASYGMLSFSYAMQDFTQSGLPAVMNNIPMMVMGLGGSSGLAGATMIAAAAFQLLQPHMESLGKKLNYLRDPLRDAANDIAGLTEKVKALEEKPFKIAADYTALREMKERLTEAKKAIEEWEALKAARSESQQTAKGIIDEGIKEGGGAKNVEASILEIKKKQGTLYADSTMHGDLAVALDREKKARNAADAAARNPVMAPFSGSMRMVADQFKAEAETVRQAMDNEAKEKIAKTVARASTSEAARKELEDYYIGNRQVFEKHGVSNKFGAAIVGASAENVEAVKDNKQSVKQQEHDAAEKKARTTKAITDNYPGVDDQLQKSIFDAMKGGATPEAAMAGQRGGLLGTLKDRKVGDDIVGKVADELLRKAGNAAQNLIAEGGKPRIDVKSDMEKTKADAERNKAINAEIHRVGPGYNSALELALEKRVAGGQRLDPATNALTPQLRARLGSRSVPADLQADVATEMMRQIANKVANKVALAPDIHQAAGVVAAGDSLKGLRATVGAHSAANTDAYAREFQIRTGANDEQAMEAGKKVAGLVSHGANAEAAMHATYAEMNGHINQVGQVMLRMMAMNERAMGEIGQASMMLNMIKARQDQFDTKLKMNAINNRRGRTQGQTGMMTFGQGN